MIFTILLCQKLWRSVPDDCCYREKNLTDLFWDMVVLCLVEQKWKCFMVCDWSFLVTMWTAVSAVVVFMCVAKHLQKSVPVKVSSLRGGTSGPTTQQKPAQQNHVVPGTSVNVTSQQRPPSGASSSPQCVLNRPPATAVSSSSHPSHEQLLRHELQKLQKEKERLRREQEDAVRKVGLHLKLGCHS